MAKNEKVSKSTQTKAAPEVTEKKSKSKQKEDFTQEVKVVKRKKVHRLSSAKKAFVLVLILAIVFLGLNAQLEFIELPIPLIGEKGIGSSIPMLAVALIALALLLYFPKPKNKSLASAVAPIPVIELTAAEAAAPVKPINALFEEDDDDIFDRAADAGPLNFAFDKYAKPSVQEINGGLYAEVVKFDDKMRSLELTGASDLDIIQISMTGSAKFEDLLTTERSSQTLSAKDICQYAMSRTNCVTIKKRGDINWTFKYGSKSFLIVREGKDGYKVSVKCFPDAVVQLNKSFMALEDSNFPSGPIWFSFSELRNLPPKIIKWLIDTAHTIAKLQQMKTDLLRTVKSSEELGINEEEIAAAYKAGNNIIKTGKFTLVFQKGSDADLRVLLIDPIEGLDSKGYTKELYYKFSAKEKKEEEPKKRAATGTAASAAPAEAPYPFKDLSVTMLPDKSVNEEGQVSFFERIEQILSK